MTDVKSMVDANALSGVSLKKVNAATERLLPSVEGTATAKQHAEEEPEPIPKQFLPKIGNGHTHLVLIKNGTPPLTKIEMIKEPALPSAE
jgi:hypothetical protein